MGRRTLLLLAALLLAALGTGLVWVYVQGADDRAQRNVAPISIYYTIKPIPLGTEASQLELQHYVARKDVSAQIAGGALTSLTPLQGLAATVPIPANIPLTPDQFTVSGKVPAAIEIPLDKMALEVALGDPNRVAPFLTTGSLVTIFVTGTPTSADPATKPATTTKTVINHPVRVITVAGTPTQALARTTGAGQSVAQAIVTLELTPDEAAQVIQAQNSGALYFGLLNPGVGPSPGVGQPKQRYTSTDIFR